MAATGGATVEGGARLQRAFRRMGASLADLEATHDAAAQPILASARTAVPIVTGALLDTLRVERDDLGGSAVLAGSDQVRYAGVINYGWPARNIEAQPFMEEAAIAGEAAAFGAYVDRVDDAVRVFDREAP